MPCFLPHMVQMWPKLGVPASSTYGPNVAQAWSYKDKNQENDIFGVQDFRVKVKSLDKLQLHLQAQPYIHLVTGHGFRIPRLSIKIYEVSTGKKVYKARKSLCKFAEPECPLERDQNVDIKVKLDNLDLTAGTEYCAEVLIIKECGAHLATVQVEFIPTDKK
eukprot:CAMPEP_0114449494 /NCGR_PEP_ID=MMETSP0103-20121206/20894_1 /TAXON_ID=37642 ORGANISM="Paraphysomonas imperforata, Strain PA2" /NCGR_SAMPLE_ID=MMETSP0103 /ASSEMBLY_ACC=CAM_ASM_000201 /LENGTH=161 /DNA_ID=CAMNT_0001621591 /DNA_START=215 /DNA_END=701 /DNA_ORIENTATION=-